MFSSQEKNPVASQHSRAATNASNAAISLPAVPAIQRNDTKEEKEGLAPPGVAQPKSIAQFDLTDDKEKLPVGQGKFVLQREEAAPAKSNNTGLTDNLKSGVEQLSGFDMSDVKVHYNSDKPAQLNAHAFAQGTDIHVGSGQEQHLPHEAWHVAQQKQGRVQATAQLKEDVPINDDPGLEHEADIMGAKAATIPTTDN